MITPEQQALREHMKILSAVELDKRLIAPMRWAIPGVLPGGATLLVGGSKLGKSWWLLEAGIAIASGTLAFGHVHVEQGRVLLLCLEDTLWRLQDRLRRMLGDQEMPPELDIVNEWPRLDQGGAQQLAQYLSLHPNTRLVGIDTLHYVRALNSGKSGRLYDADASEMTEFKRVADAHNVALVVIHHTRKRAAADPFDLVNGTTGMAGAADTTLVFSRRRDSKAASLYGRGRDVQEYECALTFDAESCRWTLEADAAKAFALTLPPKQREIADLLATRQEGLTPAEIAAALGANSSTMRNQLSAMLNAKRVTKRDDRYFAAAFATPEHPRQTRQPLPETDRQTRQDGQATVPLSIASSVSSGVQQEEKGTEVPEVETAPSDCAAGEDDSPLTEVPSGCTHPRGCRNECAAFTYPGCPYPHPEDTRAIPAA